jgi:hypothetical protein
VGAAGRPEPTAEPLELALSSCDAEDRQRLTRHGWRVRDALAVSREILPYRDYIRGSRGEFTVAKDQNIRLRTGWFSDRSACYLAAGRPVLTQETGFGKVLPTGKGLFALRTMEDILDALDRVASDYEGIAERRPRSRPRTSRPTSSFGSSASKRVSDRSAAAGSSASRRP